MSRDRALAAAFLLALSSPALAQDALIVGNSTGAPGAIVEVPISIRDLAGTPLGRDATAGSRIQGIAVSIAFAPAGAVSSATIVRSGITASLTPLFESSGSTPGTVGHIVSFSETASPLLFTQPPPLAGNEVLRLRITLAPGATGTITLTPQPASTALSNQGGTVSETVEGGGLILTAGTVTLSAAQAVEVPALGEVGMLTFALSLAAAAWWVLRRS